MNKFESLRAITRRALRINYISPGICQLVSSYDDSGSGFSETSILEVLPTTQSAGPFLRGFDTLGGVRLEWEEIPDAGAYVVYRANSPAGPFVLQASGVLDNEFSETVPAGTYYYRVTGIEPDYGETEFSNTVQVTT